MELCSGRGTRGIGEGRAGKPGSEGTLRHQEPRGAGTVSLAASGGSGASGLRAVRITPQEAT